MQLQSLKKPSNLKKNRFRLHVGIAITTCIFFSFLYLLSAFFSVKKIEITGKPSINLNGLANLKNKNLLFLSSEIEEKNLLVQNPNLKKITLVKVYPDSLFLSVEENKYIAAIKLNLGYGYLDPEAKLLLKKKEQDPSIPVITFYQYFDYSQLQTGDKLNYIELVTALFFLKNAQELAFDVTSIDINGSSMIVFNLKDEVKLLFTTEKDKEKQLYELERTVRQFKIEARSFKALDLRFDKPIVKFE